MIRYYAPMPPPAGFVPKCPDMYTGWADIRYKCVYKFKDVWHIAYRFNNNLFFDSEYAVLNIMGAI